MATLALSDLSCGYGQTAILRQIDLTLDAGEVLFLLGPNGVGKTTLFKTILRLLPPLAGQIRVGGEDTRHWPSRRFASAIGYVPQAHTPPFPFSVLDVVSMGRAAHLGTFAQPSGEDMAIAWRALERLAASHLADRTYTEISGGERQLVLIARALAQETTVLVMDEPTSNLDFGNQIAVLETVRSLAETAGLAVVMTSHDPNHALTYAHRVAAIGRTGTLAVGLPTSVVTEDYLRATYGIRTRMIHIPPHTLCVPMGRGEMPCAPR